MDVLVTDKGDANQSLTDTSGETEEDSLSVVGTLLRLSCLCHNLNLVVGFIIEKVIPSDECRSLSFAIDKVNNITSLSLPVYSLCRIPVYVPILCF